MRMRFTARIATISPKLCSRVWRVPCAEPSQSTRAKPVASLRPRELSEENEMRIYTVHVPAAAGSGALAFERAAFVRDGFYVFAFLFSIFWCLWRGLWISALAILALGVAVVGVSRF